MTTDTAPVPVTPPRPKLKANRLTWLGTRRQLLTLFLINLLFTVGSLGFYLPWAIGSLRDYVARNLRLNQQQVFASTAQPLSLLAGIGIAATGAALLVFLFRFAVNNHLPSIPTLTILLGYAGLYAGVYASLLYRWNSVTLRGQPFHLNNRIFAYLLLAVRRGFLNLVTLGFSLTESDRRKWEFICNGLSYKGIPFSAAIAPQDMKPLVWINLVSLWLPLLPVITLVMLLVQLPPELAAGPRGHFLVLLGLLISVLGLLGRSAYRAALWTLRVNRLRIGSLRMRSLAPAGDLARLKASNLLLLLLTCGLACPFVIHRTMEFHARTLVIGGDTEKI